MTDRSQPAPLGSFALVSYIPDPLGSFLHELRSSLPGVEYPEPHITILPPRPLTVPVEHASALVRAILESFSSFDVELQRVRCFLATHVFYIDLGDGDAAVRQLHNALSSKELAFPEEFEFRPHLTLSGSIPEEDLESATKKAEAGWESAVCSRRFSLREIVFLWSPAETSGEWQRLSVHVLRGSAKAASATPRSRI